MPETKTERPLFSRQEYLPDGRHLCAGFREGTAFPLHAHEYYEMEAVAQGSGCQWVNGRRMPLQPGSIYLLSPGDFHEITQAEGLLLCNIVFDETVLPPDVCRALFGTLPFCRQLEEPVLQRLLTAAGLLETEPDAQAAAALAQYVFRLCAGGGAALAPLTPVQRAVVYVQEHFRDAPSLAQAAAVACLSPTYFGAQFRQAVGCTYVEYLNRCRVDCARMLLRQGVSVTEACFGSGFGSVSGFLYTFRRQTGLTPQAYRAAALGRK